MTCLKAYSDFTGDQNPAVYINAGGTYGRKLKKAAEIGTTLIWGAPGNTPSGHAGAHQPDECISIEGFLQALELTLLCFSRATGWRTKSWHEAAGSYDLLKCEAHLSKAKQILSILFHDEVEETKLWQIKIIELQKMPV